MPAKTIDQRVVELEQIVASIPDILNVRFDHARSDRARIIADVAEVKAALTVLQAEVRSMPRVIAELIRDMDRGD